MNSNLSLFAQGELLILPDGKILAHNVTPELAAILTELDPENKLMRQRVHEATSKKRRHRAKRYQTFQITATGVSNTATLQQQNIK